MVKEEDFDVEIADLNRTQAVPKTPYSGATNKPHRKKKKKKKKKTPASSKPKSTNRPPLM